MRRYEKTVDASRGSGNLVSVRRAPRQAGGAKSAPAGKTAARRQGTRIPFTSRQKPRKAVKSVNAPPPVLRRNPEARPAAHSARGGKHRKRYDVALSVPGAELRLPSLPQVQIGWRIVSFAIVAALGGLLIFLWTSPMFVVEAAGLSGADRVTAEEMNLVIGVSGRPVFSVDAAQVEESLSRAFPEMSAITVEVGLPATISVTVQERRPVISWLQGEQEYWIDSSGTAFPPRGTVQGLVVVVSHAPLPEGVTLGITATQLIEPQMVEALLQLREVLPAGTPLLYDEVHGLGWQDGHGWYVYFGRDLADMDMKLKVYQNIANYVGSNGIVPKFISVEQLHAPYYRVEP